MTDIFCNLGIIVIGPDDIEAETPIIVLDLNARDDCCKKNDHDCCNKNNHQNNAANAANLNIIRDLDNRNRCCNTSNLQNDCTDTQTLIKELGIRVLTNC